LASALRIQPVSSQAADFKVLNDDVGFVSQTNYPVQIIRIAKISGYGALAAIAGVEVRRTLHAIGFDPWRAPLSRVIAGWAFYLDDISTQVCQCLTNPGPSQNAGEFQYAYAFQWRFHCFSLSSN
jgi:hypothetical protein